MAHAPSSRVSLTLACGRTVGPGLEGSPGGGGWGGALVGRGAAVAGGIREGYLRAAPLAVRAAFEDEEPMIAGVYRSFTAWVQQGGSRAQYVIMGLRRGKFGALVVENCVNCCRDDGHGPLIQFTSMPPPTFPLIPIGESYNQWRCHHSRANVADLTVQWHLRCYPALAQAETRDQLVH